MSYEQYNKSINQQFQINLNSVLILIIIISFISLLIFVNYFLKIQEKMYKEELNKMKNEIVNDYIMEVNKKLYLIEEKIADKHIDIQIMQDKTYSKITEIENKNNELFKEYLKLKNEQKQIKMDSNLNQCNKIKSLINETQLIKDELQYNCLKQNENLASLSSNVNNIFRKVNRQQLILDDMSEQSRKFQVFLDNYSILTRDCNGIFYNIKLGETSIIPLQYINGIGIHALKLLYSMEKTINIKYYNDYDRIKIYQHLADGVSSGHLTMGITILNNDDVCRNDNYHIPIYMLCLLFKTRIIAFNGEDVTDLFENNFYSVKRYHDFMSSSNSESKKISNVCDIKYVRKLFE